MKKIYTCIVVGVTTLMLIMSSCSGFLDQDSREHIEKDDAEDLGPDVFLNGAYGLFTDWDYAFSYLGVSSIISDNADKGSSATDPGGDKQDIDDLKFNTSSGSFGSMWKNWYNTIGRATRAIEAAEVYSKPIDEAYRARIIGEAKFLRAVAYFFMVRGWGDVPMQERGEEFLSERVPVAEVYAHIEQDLKDAMAVLPVKYGAADTGRATKGAAHGLLAKVYLYQKKYQEAYDAAKIVADKTVYGYELVSDYATIWRVEGENSSESLFEIQARGDAIPHGIKQYSQTQALRGGDYHLGWGFNIPSQNLLDAYNAEGDVVRRDATIIFRGTPLYDGQQTTGTENPMYNYKAYSSANKGAEHTDKNLRYLRLGEIILIKAEAANELGNTSEAATVLNQVRTRVNLGNTPATSQADLRKAIWNERRLELAFEHDRWFDLIRTGQAKAAMAVDGKTFIEGKHELFPISDQQMNDSNYEMVQNPGWN